MNDKKERWLAVACAITGNTVWGFSFLFSKVAMEVTNPDVLLSIRFILALIIMTVMILTGKARLDLKGKSLTPIIALGILELIYFYCESYGVYYTNSTFAGVILSIVPVVSLLFALVFLKEYPTKHQALFSLLPIAGVIIVTIAGNSMGIIRPIGVVLLLLTCVSSGAYKTVNRKSASAFGSFERTFVILLICTPPFTVAALRSVDWSLGAYLSPLTDLRFLIPVLILSVFCSIGANMMVNYAAGRMSVVELATYGALTTVCSMFAGIVFLDEPITMLSLIGSLLILVGVWQVTKPTEK